MRGKRSVCIYMSIRLCVLICLAGGLLLTSCARTSQTQRADSSEVPSENREEKIASEERNDEEYSSEMVVVSGDPEGDDSAEIPSEDVDTEPEILNFVDVFGEEYQVEINPDVIRHPYELNNFHFDGQMLSYEDDSYNSRLGIDVSYHQGEIDWEKVAAQGIEFAIIRIGYRGYGQEGHIKEDPKYAEYIEEAKSAGLDVGVYFFAQAIDEREALEEADFVLSILNGCSIDLPVAYDPESILDSEARTDDVSGEQFTKNTRVFCDRIKQAGYQPMIYANMLWEAYELDLSQFQDVPIWYADYEPTPQTPYNFEFLQYSNEGRVVGISGACDLDVQILRR